MLVKDIIKIEKGTLIKGLTVKPYRYNNNLNEEFDPNNKNTPRIATLNVDGWDYPESKFHYPIVRTIFYPNESKPSFVIPCVPEDIKKVGINNSMIKDPWNYWADYRFIEFKNGDPIGVHMSEFVFGYLNKNKKKYINFYTKILLISGEMGYLALETEDKNKIEAELI